MNCTRSDNKTYEVVVIGGGHAGCEAALACARMGHRVLLVTISLETIGQMSCNPAIGGLAKGQLVKEIDALGGVMGRLADKVGLQFKMLNRTRGPAVWSPRAQADKKMYQVEMRKLLEEEPNLDLRQGTVVEILAGEIDASGRKEVLGVELESGLKVFAKVVIVSPGTFMNGIIHIGLRTLKGGRSGEVSSLSLPESLKKLGLKLGRLKTGTSPRVLGRTLDFSKMIVQPGDDAPTPFSYLTPGITQSQLPCYITRTTEQTHEIIRRNLDKSPLYSGRIKGIGPRYCPSIEDKVIKFPERDSHQIFLEPEGRETDEYYINGLSTSLPEEIQEEIVQSIPGLEKAKIIRPGYAVEYDFVFPTQLTTSLEVKDIEGLFLAGQINGSSGYEEAASQGLMAGINASLKLERRERVELLRSEAYIGVLIDDLVTKGTEEPYRMFTSRAEYRLILRQDNAPERLLDKGYRLGLVDNETFIRFGGEQAEVWEALEYLRGTVVSHEKVLEVTRHAAPEAGGRIGRTYLDVNKGVGIRGKDVLAEGDVGTRTETGISGAALTLAQFLKRPGITREAVSKLAGVKRFSPKTWEKLEVLLKYEGYIERQEKAAKRMAKLAGMRIPEALFDSRLRGLSKEGVERLIALRPSTIGQALRIPGVSPADISVLLVHLERHKRTGKGSNHPGEWS